jgi:hypothetical protein
MHVHNARNRSAQLRAQFPHASSKSAAQKCPQPWRSQPNRPALDSRLVPPVRTNCCAPSICESALTPVGVECLGADEGSNATPVHSPTAQTRWWQCLKASCFGVFQSLQSACELLPFRRLFQRRPLSEKVENPLLVRRRRPTGPERLVCSHQPWLNLPDI